MKLTPEEDAVYMKAFKNSAAKSVKMRMAQADAALAKYREGGEMRAVEKGIEDANSPYKLKNRKKRLDEAIDGEK